MSECGMTSQPMWSSGGGVPGVGGVFLPAAMLSTRSGADGAKTERKEEGPGDGEENSVKEMHQ